MGVIFLFVDGLGLGEDQENNPLAQLSLPGLTRFSGDRLTVDTFPEGREWEHVVRAVDATLDIDGLPQSGTGQATLFSGENAAAVLGRHHGPFPHSQIKYLLRRHSLFHRLRGVGGSCYFMNAYPDIFFRQARERDRWSCTTLMAGSSGMELNTVEQIRSGDAVTAELKQDFWRANLGIDVPEITPEQAADRVLVKSRTYDLVLFEYYLTDRAGHRQEIEMATWVLQRLDAFLWHLLENRHPDDTLLLTSDHGNIEDLSVKTHTLNRVPLLVQGSAAPWFAGCKSIQDVTPSCIDWFNAGAV